MALLELKSIVKEFPGVRALDGVSFDLHKGEVHALCGENGAGKSTLGKILAGIHRPDGGRVLVEGRAVEFNGPPDALHAGIGIVHQELAFCDNLTVAENLCLGSLPATATFVSKREMIRRAEAMLSATGAAIDVRRLMRELTIGQQQVVQIAAAIGRGARIIVFDEPTSSLSQHEADRLLAEGADCRLDLRRQRRVLVVDQHDAVGAGGHADVAAARAQHVEPVAEVGRRLLHVLEAGRRSGRCRWCRWFGGAAGDGQCGEQHESSHGDPQ